MTNTNWFPPRGAVTVTPDPVYTGSSQVDCAACGFHYPRPEYSSTRTDADDQKRNHRCPVGTVGAYPACPVCKSVGKACRNLEGNPQTQWHSPRTDVWADAVGDQA